MIFGDIEKQLETKEKIERVYNMTRQPMKFPTEYYLYYNGKYYDVGTKVLCKTEYDLVREGIITGTHNWISINFKGVYQTFDKRYIDKYIVEIIDPVEVYPTERVVITNNRVCPIGDDEFYGTIWYIFIMIVGTIFQARVGIWLFATIVFLLWKNGYLNGGK